MKPNFYIKQYGTVVGPHTALELFKLGLPKETMVCEEYVTKGEWVALGDVDIESLCNSDDLEPINVEVESAERNIHNSDGETANKQTEAGNDAIPNNLDKWNWGAFALPVIWGLCNGVYWTIGVGVGLVALSFALAGVFLAMNVDDMEKVAEVVMGAVTIVARLIVARVANRVSWKATCNDRTAQKFEQSQKTWNVVGVILIVVYMFVVISQM